MHKDVLNGFLDVALVVVSHSPANGAHISRGLAKAGFSDIRTAATADSALSMMRERRADIAVVDLPLPGEDEVGLPVADWLLPDMDGLSFAAAVRDLDDGSEQHTYTILVATEADVDSIKQAFEYGADDLITSGSGERELLARVYVGSRTRMLHGQLRKWQRDSEESRRQTQQMAVFDTATGLGNHAYLHRQLEYMLSHVASRGGSGCLGLVRINSIEELARAHGQSIADEVTEAVARRLRQTVRPLDVVAGLDADTFGVVMYQSGANTWHPNAFRRLLRALNLRAYRTSAGFLLPGVAISLVSVSSEDSGKPSAKALIALARDNLSVARASGQAHLVPWKERREGVESKHDDSLVLKRRVNDFREQLSSAVRRGQNRSRDIS